jgi:hypothetical protein
LRSDFRGCGGGPQDPSNWRDESHPRFPHEPFVAALPCWAE